MLVSVIIPCFNVENYIVGCVNSVLKQEHKELEIICVDNNSSDGTLSVLHKINKEYPSIKVLRENNPGACYARNKGLDASNSEYIQFLDADDILMPQKISSQVNIAEKGLCEIVIGDYSRVKLNGERVEIIPVKNDSWLGLLSTRLGITSSCLWKKEAVVKAGGWNTQYQSSQEYELMFRLMQHKSHITFDDVNNTLVQDRKAGNISSLNLSRSWFQYCNLRAEILNYVIKNNINPTKHGEYYQVLFDAIRTLAKYDLKRAVSLFKKNIPSCFSPAHSAATSPSYILLYNLLGFHNSERVKNFFN